jgi:hypothetical protein
MSRLERPALTGKPLKRGARLVIAATAAALLSTALAPASFAQAPLVENVAKQPLTVHVEGLMEALTFLGRPLPEADRARLKKAAQLSDAEAAKEIQAVLDAQSLVVVDIDSNRRVKVAPLAATTAKLTKNGWTTFLVKIVNGAKSTDTVDVDSPEAAMPYDFSRMQVERSVYEDQFTDVMLEKHFHIGTTWGTWGGGYPYKEPPQPELQSESGNLWPPHGDLSFVPTKERWAAVSLYQESPLSKHLSGLGLEYAVLQVYSRDEGDKSMTLSFNIGTQQSSGTGSVPFKAGNPGMRGEAKLNFSVGPAVPVKLKIADEDGSPTAARFLIRDKLDRVYPYRTKRYAPDLFFQNHIYRFDGETVELPPGEYSVEIRRGPHYLPQTQKITVAAGQDAAIDVKLKRWINTQALGLTSDDKHVHTAGCLHYNDPTYGLTPEDMLRYAVGEDLDIADIMIWGPNFYYQKEKYFTGKPSPVSTAKNVVTHNLEISQFPSAAGGHTSGHGIKEIDYPGAKRMKDWPSYTLPVMKWVQSQGGLSSYTHSGFGLDVQSTELPNYITPPMDSIGANEFIMTVAHGAVDWIGVGNTNFISELNIWYHTLNAGFRTLIGGETDWPCINGDAIGRGRSYVKTGVGAVDYDKTLKLISEGRGMYVSDGRSHLMNFKVNGKEQSRVEGEELKLDKAGKVKVTADVAAYLPEAPETVQILGVPYPMDSEAVRYVPMSEPKTIKIQDIPILGVSWRNIPWWHLERARQGDGRDVKVEVIVNGEPVASKAIAADGSIQKVEFDIEIDRSAWVALRILGASHSVPIWVLVDNKPVRVAKSIEWDIAALGQAFEVKRRGWRAEDYPEAKAAYEYAYEVYAKRLREAQAN